MAATHRLWRDVPVSERITLETIDTTQTTIGNTPDRGTVFELRRTAELNAWHRADWRARLSNPPGCIAAVRATYTLPLRYLPCSQKPRYGFETCKPHEYLQPATCAAWVGEGR